jgi:hypothetical protein
MALVDTTINTAEAVDDSETVIDCSADPTSVISNNNVVQIGTDAEKMLVTDRSAGTGIDIGPAAVDGGNNYGNNYSRLLLTNPANATGTITTIEVWAVTGNDITNMKIGTFYNTGTNKYKCRAVITIASVTAGSKQTFTGLSLAVSSGDVLGFILQAGQIERTDGTSAGVQYIFGDTLSVNNESTYQPSTDETASLYGSAVGTPTITVERGYLGTTPEAHSTGTDINKWSADPAGIPRLLAGGLF